MTSLEDELQHSRKFIRDRGQPRWSDGLLLVGVKLATGPQRWWHDAVFLTIINHVSSRLHGLYHDENNDDGPLFRMSIDVYMMLWTALLVFVYLIAYVSVGRNSCIASVAMILATVLSTMRIYEIWAFIALLHAGEYRSSSKIRPIINTVWHYCEVAIGFGVIYLAISHFVGDEFAADKGAQTIRSSAANAAYFSFVTLTTIGYGDLSPKTDVGKTVVVIEVILGFFLLLVVLQRAMAEERQDDANGEPRAAGH
ncbi:MAG TPA: potassium channel family protein [Pirellulales bacterium]|jgi:hypothetical protein|nr:potassium channel family protein [Pirellulales bacterium]